MSSRSKERRRSKDTSRRRKNSGPSDEAESSWRDRIVIYVVDTLVNARSTCTEKADDCASRSRTHSSRRRSKAKVSRERSTSKARRAREVSEIEPAPPWPLISKEMTQPCEVEEPQADDATEELVPAASREEQDAPTAVSCAGLEEVPLVPSEEEQHSPTVSNANPDDAQEKVSLVPSEEEQHSPTVSNANPDGAQEKVFRLPSEEELHSPTVSVLPVPSEEEQHSPTVSNANPDDAQEEVIPVAPSEEGQHSPTVSNANPDDAQEEGFPVPSGEEQHSPTVVSSVHSGDLPKDVFLAETDVKWQWPAWCFQQSPPCIEVCVFEDDDQYFHWLPAVGKPPPAAGSLGENYLAAEYVYRNESFTQEFHPSHVRKMGKERTVAHILLDGE